MAGGGPRTEWLVERHEWWRISDPAWENPLDPSFAQRFGARWNPPQSFPTLYFNEDVVTARCNLRLFIASWPYEPEDLRDDTGPVLVGATLPRKQRVLDAHTPEGLTASGLPRSYPLDDERALVRHAVCQSVGVRAHRRKLRGVRCRSARAPDGAGRELAWFPAGSRSRARRKSTLSFSQWFWG